MTFDPNFDPIEGARIEREEDTTEVDRTAELRNQLYGDSRGILAQVDGLVANARAAADAAGALRELSEAQDGLIHAIIDVHTLIHLELGRAQS